MIYAPINLFVYTFILICLQFTNALSQIGQSSDKRSLSVDVELIAENILAPVDLEAARDGSNRLFIVEQSGKILIYQHGKILSKPFLDLTEKLDRLSSFYSEKGLLGLAMHPNFSQNGRFFVYYSAATRSNADHKSVVEEYRVDPKSKNVALTNGKLIIEIDQPESNHNGGDLAFGIDGYLYIATGDGGGANDRHGTIGNSQDLSNLLGKILRIDVDVETAYRIPQFNPFTKGKARPEIWAYGLRNPWRISFDKLTGKLFTGDVGQNKIEEIDIIEKGKNYGWRIMEGYNCFNPSKNCDKTGLILPIHEYPHSVGISVTGGYVYRGDEIESLYGKYVYAEWNGKLFYLSKDENDLWSNYSLNIRSINGNNLKENINSFGEDENGELYILSQDSGGPFSKKGKVYKIIK
ncbi:MAG: glucose dehydrogenase [Bacteroidia bacterium]|nr:glucose dehydrogenase [Bacteroidia bacterium]